MREEHMTRCYGIVLIPDQAATLNACVASAELAALGTSEPDVLLDEDEDGTCLPHVSLFHLMTDPGLIPDLVERLRPILEMRGRFTGRFTTVVAAGPYVFWRTERSLELDALHRAVVRACQPLRLGQVPIDWQMDEAQKELHERFGYPNCMGRFDPHLTLARLPQDQIPRAVQTGFERPQMWTCFALTIGLIGEHGKLIRTLEHLPFAD